MDTQIGIRPENLAKVSQELSKILADEFVLYTKTRNAHWNIEGADFYSMHKFFETQYEQLDEILDDVAERIRSIGHYAPASLEQYLELTHLTEQTRSEVTGVGYIKELLTDHGSIVMKLRENINRFANEFNDLGTSDFITGLMEKHEKMAWMLRSHVH